MRDDELAELRAELSRLRARVDELERERSPDHQPEPRSTRRDAFKLAAGAAVGAVAGTVGASTPAAAADPNDLVLQTRNTAGGSRTQLDYTGTGHPMGLVVESGAAFDGASSSHPAALGGWATQAAQPNGVYAFTNQTGGYALAAQSDGGLGAALLESTDGYALVAKSSVADGRNTEGVVIAPDVVPEGATAISFNLTVDRTGPSNFLAVVPGSAGGFNTSSINWTAANSAVANGLTVGINTAREVKVFCGDGTGGTDFLIDVNGYWR